MIQYLIIGIMAVGATLGGSFAASILANSNSKIAELQEPTVLEFMKLEPISVPIIRKSKIQGYVVVRAVIKAEAAEVKNNKSEIGIYSSEAVFRAIFEEESLNFTALKPVDMTALAKRIGKLANERLGKGTLKKVALESLYFVTRQEVEANRKH